MAHVAAFTDSYLPTLNGVTYTVQTWSEWWGKRGSRMDVVYPNSSHDADTGEYPVPSIPFPFYEGFRVGVPKIPAGVGGADLVHAHTPFSLGLAGLRLGYAVVPEPWADAYARVNTPFAASEVACRAGLAALDDDAHVEQTVETVRWARGYIRDELSAPTFESHGNFVLAEVGDATAATEALKRRGVIIRDCTSFGLPDCVRITCGTESETRRAVAELNGVLAE